MATIHLHETTTATPEQFIAALTDFGPGRAKVFGNSADGYLEVHAQGATDADVTEGSAGIWERLQYDWSNPEHVVLKTMDWNTWSDSSGHTYDFTRQPDGRTAIDYTIVRDGKGFKGHAVELLLGLGGKRMLGKAFDKTVRAIEARNAGV